MTVKAFILKMQLFWSFYSKYAERSKTYFINLTNRQTFVDYRLVAIFNFMDLHYFTSSFFYNSELKHFFCLAYIHTFTQELEKLVFKFNPCKAMPQKPYTCSWASLSGEFQLTLSFLIILFLGIVCEMSFSLSGGGVTWCLSKA